MFWPWWSSDYEADIIPKTWSFFSLIRQRMTPPQQCMPMLLTWRRPFLTLQTPLLQLAHRPASPSVLLRTPPPNQTRPDGRSILTTTAVRSTTTTLPQDRAVGLIPVAPQQEQVWSLWASSIPVSTPSSAHSLGSDWEQLLDETTGRHYYYNHALKQTSWTAPEPSPPPSSTDEALSHDKEENGPVR